MNQTHENRTAARGASPLAAICVALGVFAAASTGDAAESDSRPNILFIFTDDQSHRTVGCYEESHPWVTTPNIDRLARDGLRFTDAYAASWCLPSRAVVLSGRHPHGIQGIEIRENPYSRYDPEVFRFWPSAFRKAGYTTAVIGKWHLSEDTGQGRAWDHSVIWNHAVPEKAGGYYVDQKLNFDGGPYRPVGGYSTDNYTRYALDFVRRQHQKPWFLWLCYDAVHHPYLAAERHRGSYRSGEAVPIAKDIYPPRPDKPRYMKNYGVWIPGDDGIPRLNRKLDWLPLDLKQAPDRLDEAVRQYNRGVLAIDEGVGQLVKALEESGQLDNTLIVFTSDQGYAWGQHGFAWKIGAYDANMRIPFIVRWPGHVAKGRVCRHPVGMVDLIPTFFGVAGIPLPWTMHGHDLSPILKDPAAPWTHPVLLEHFFMKFGSQTDRALGGEDIIGGIPWWLSLRKGRYKYIRTLVEDEVEELYDLEADPQELHNLALDPKHRETLSDYRQRLVKELTRTGAGLVGNLPKPRVVE